MLIKKSRKVRAKCRIEPGLVCYLIKFWVQSYHNLQTGCKQRLFLNKGSIKSYGLCSPGLLSVVRTCSIV